MERLVKRCWQKLWKDTAGKLSLAARLMSDLKVKLKGYGWGWPNEKRCRVP